MVFILQDSTDGHFFQVSNSVSSLHSSHTFERLALWNLSQSVQNAIGLGQRSHSTRLASGIREAFSGRSSWMLWAEQPLDGIDCFENSLLVMESPGPWNSCLAKFWNYEYMLEDMNPDCNWGSGKCKFDWRIVCFPRETQLEEETGASQEKITY